MGEGKSKITRGVDDELVGWIDRQLKICGSAARALNYALYMLMEAESAEATS